MLCTVINSFSVPICNRISAATKMTGRPAVIIEKQNNGTGGSPGAGVATASFSKAADAPKQARKKSLLLLA